MFGKGLQCDARRYRSRACDCRFVRFQRAAGKNAFQLLSQHRNDVAAAFFLLAKQCVDTMMVPGASLWLSGVKSWRFVCVCVVRYDRAIKTCMNELNDPMMALLVARLLDGNVAAEELGLLSVSGTAVPPFGKFDSSAELSEYGQLKPLANTYEVEAPGTSSAATRVLVKAEKDFADFVLRSHFLRASVEQRDPWLASLSLWLLKLPIFASAVLLTGQTAVVYPLVPPMPGKPKVRIRRVGYLEPAVL